MQYKNTESYNQNEILVCKEGFKYVIHVIKCYGWIN